jgi:hypothetical protein
MKQVSMIGLDLAKNVFAVHGIDAAGNVVIRRSFRRAQLEKFFPSCRRPWWEWKRAAAPIIGGGGWAGWATRSG